jgi:prepilin-type N-terminal cleavage/methylation domain-containing protein
LNKKQNSIKGFTLIEALVSMVIFGIGFSGLYFLYGMALQSNSNTEKKMYMNLMANRIIETISTEAQRLSTDSEYNTKSPFKVPSLYSGSLNNCSGLSDPKLTWCNDLNTSIGQFTGISVWETRNITITSANPSGDPTGISSGLIVNVSLVAESGAVNRIFVQTYATRHIRNYNQ